MLPKFRPREADGICQISATRLHAGESGRGPESAAHPATARFRDSGTNCVYQVRATTFTGPGSPQPPSRGRLFCGPCRREFIGAHRGISTAGHRFCFRAGQLEVIGKGRQYFGPPGGPPNPFGPELCAMARCHCGPWTGTISGAESFESAFLLGMHLY